MTPPATSDRSGIRVSYGRYMELNMESRTHRHRPQQREASEDAGCSAFGGLRASCLDSRCSTSTR